MYDHGTKSFWSTLHGEPVVGPLVGKGIKLNRRYLVTTTWGEWKKRHPDTTVLSLQTGHRRNYGEGVAYHNYFATDQLMFTVPKIDTRSPSRCLPKRRSTTTKLAHRTSLYWQTTTEPVGHTMLAKPNLRPGTEPIRPLTQPVVSGPCSKTHSCPPTKSSTGCRHTTRSGLAGFPNSQRRDW